MEIMKVRIYNSLVPMSKKIITKKAKIAKNGYVLIEEEGCVIFRKKLSDINKLVVLKKA